MKKHFKKAITIFTLALFLFSAYFFILPNTPLYAKQSNSISGRFIYIDKTNFTISVLEGDINNPANSGLIFGPVSIAGPREYFKDARCTKPGTKGCINYKNENDVAEGIYTINTRKNALPMDSKGRPYSVPYQQFKNQVCNGKEPLKMYYPLKIIGTKASGINIHTYNTCVDYDPNNTHYDSWGKPLPKGDYTHGCWALSFKNAKILYDNYAFDGMEVRFAHQPYNTFPFKAGKDRSVPQRVQSAVRRY